MTLISINNIIEEYPAELRPLLTGAKFKSWRVQYSRKSFRAKLVIR